MDISRPGAKFRSISRKRLLLTKCAIFLAALLIGTPAFAILMVLTGVDNTGTDNVIANAACAPLQSDPAFAVQGCLNTQHATLINFTSDENIEYSGGQASLVAEDLAFNFLTISLAAPDTTFNKLLLNIDAIADGFVTFTGSPGGSSSPFPLSANGENKFIIFGDDFLSVALATTTGVGDLKQVRIGGIQDATTPDVSAPGTLLLMGLGLLGLCKTLRDRSRS